MRTREEFELTSSFSSSGLAFDLWCLFSGSLGLFSSLALLLSEDLAKELATGSRSVFSGLGLLLSLSTSLAFLLTFLDALLWEIFLNWASSGSGSSKNKRSWLDCLSLLATHCNQDKWTKRTKLIKSFLIAVLVENFVFQGASLGNPLLQSFVPAISYSGAFGDQVVVSSVKLEFNLVLSSDLEIVDSVLHIS
jgi:hypothetical protein